MKRTVAVLLLALAGCVGPSDVAVRSPEPLDTLAVATLDDVLEELAHVGVRNHTTLRWNLPALDDPEADVARTSLVRLWQDTNVTHVGVDGRFTIIALVPVNATTPTACGPPGEGGRATFVARDGLAATSADRLVGSYAQGWYHAIIVGAPEAQLSLTFGQGGDARLFEPLDQDPAVNLSYARMGGTERTHELPFDSGGRPWILWAAHSVAENGFDGGREHTVTVDPECAQGVQPGGNNPFIGAEDRRAVVEVAGGPSSIVVRGTYAPRVDLAAPRESRLDAVFASFEPITLPAAAPDANATSGGAQTAQASGSPGGR